MIQELKVKIKRLVPEAIIPKYANTGDAGLDLVATKREWKIDYYKYNTGISVEIPEGYVGLVFPRSSIYKKGLRLANSVGVIDSGYRGEIKAIFEYDDFDTCTPYEVGERIAQLIILPYPKVTFEEVDSLSNSIRSYGGFGSTGK